MSYQYTESGLDNVWLENGYDLRTHAKYGEGITIADVRGLHEAIGRWIVDQPRSLTGAEFRFLRVELDMSQRRLGEIVGNTEQSIANWEKSRTRPVANKAAERLLRLAYKNYIDGKPEFSAVIDRLTQLDAVIAEMELHLSKSEVSWLALAA